MRNARLMISAAALIVLAFGSIFAQTTEFTYQGSLKDGASAATGNYDFEFVLFDAVSGGTQLGSTLARNTVAVANGLFAVKLDFGSQFPGANRFLEIRVRLTGQPNLITLTPRQQVNSAPYSVKSLNADTVGGLAASGFIQNGTALQTANQNISGNAYFGGSVGIGNVVNPTTAKLYVYVAGNGVGVYGESPSGFGVWGFSPSGYGVFGKSTNSAGVHGDSTNGIGISGTSSNGAAVEGLSTSGTGVSGQSTSGTAIYGLSSAVGLTVAAVRGVNTANNGNGIIGEAGGGTGTGVYGVSTSATGYGMVGRNLAGGYAGYFDGNLLAGAFLDVNQYASGGTVSVCRNGGRLAACSSSLRYKTNIGTFDQGLSLLNKLHPITFDWKKGGIHDLGLGAEDVEKVEPLLVTYNDKGQVEGVKYDRIGVVLINAVKEQQAQIEAQDAKIKSLEMQVEAFKAIVCSQNPSADACRPRN